MVSNFLKAFPAFPDFPHEGGNAYEQQQNYLAALQKSLGQSSYLIPGMQNPGVTPRESAYFDVPGLAQQSPYGSPAEATQYAGGGPRTSLYFGPSGVQYDTLKDGFRQRVQTADAFNLQRYFTDEAYDKYRGTLGQQGQVIDQAFEEAYGYAGNQGKAARKRTLDRETQVSAEIMARAGGRGYAADYARRGLMDSTTAQLAAIDEATARLFSSLALGRGNAQANVLGNLAQSYLGQASDYYTYLTGEQNLLAGLQAQQAQGKDYSGLYNLAGSALTALGYVYGGVPGGTAAAAVTETAKKSAGSGEY